MLGREAAQQLARTTAAMPSSSSGTWTPRKTVLLSLALRLATLLALVLVPHVLPSWDPSSRSLLPPRSPAEGLLRWDTVHFIGIAERKDGQHEKEKEWAFARGIVAVLRLWWTEGDVERMRERMVLGGSVVAMAASIASGLVLYSCASPEPYEGCH